MLGRTLSRAAVRWGLALAAKVRRPIRSNGRIMDPVMSALVRQGRRVPMERVGGLDKLRRGYAQVPGLLGLAPDHSVAVESLTVAGRPARRYRPKQPARCSLVYFHGGGFIMGDLDSKDGFCRLLAARLGAEVLNVSYRLAPEHPYPAAHDDAVAALAWARTHLTAPLGVAGDSAGANLAAMLGRQNGVALQALLYPVVDMVHVEGTYPSIAEFADGYLLTAQGMEDCLSLLLPAGQDPGDPLLSPIRADLSESAPAVVMTAGFDPLRDQGSAYVRALHQAGRRAILLEEPGLAHGFVDFAGAVPAARRAAERLATAMAQHLYGGSAGATGDDNAAT